MTSLKDLRGIPEPTTEELDAAEVLKSADELARRAAAAAKNAHHFAQLYDIAAAKRCPVAKLITSASIPVVGLGTWKSEKGQVRTAVIEAIRAGYRHIDAAAVYGNEAEVGDALNQVWSEGVVTREDVFVTSKLWNTDHGRVRGACLKTLKDLQLNYLDLYLIHWPYSGRPGPSVAPPLAATWAAMEALVDEGLVRAIGVSNFSVKKTAALIEGARVVPAVNQVEAHPYWRNQELIDFCHSKSIHVTAYSPLGSPDSAGIMQRADDTPSVMRDPLVVQIAQRTGKSVAQVLIRWAVQRGTSVLPKSVHPERIAANFDVFDWQLSDADFKALSSLELQMRMLPGDFVLDAETGPYKTREDLWDGP